MIPDGYTDLPAGKIASIVTFLEMCSPPQAASPDSPEWVLRRHLKPDLDWYRSLFRTVGREWLWFSRLQLDNDALRDILHDPEVEVYALEAEGIAKGLLELDRRHMPDIELSFIGLANDVIGRGAGRFLLARALEAAWSHKPRRVLVHTCTLDHPRALDFYRRAGFVPYRRSIEVADDPRLTGTMARDAAAHFPILPAGGPPRD